MMNITETVKQLLIINILFFIGSQFVPASYEFLALHYFENEKFKLWQPLTSMFMHASLYDVLGNFRINNIAHIAFNMLALYSFGSALEYRWGAKKFIFFYISCGLGAALLYSVFNYYQFNAAIQPLLEGGLSKSTIMNAMNAQKFDAFNGIISQGQFDNISNVFYGTAVGASGAIYGLLVAFAFLYPNAELALMFIPVPIKAKYFVPGILALDLFLGLKGNSIFGDGGTGIAHFAHLGGALCGFLMMWYWKKNQFNDNRWDR
jgi:membrane associated rhomboid family serine protease